MDFRGHAVTKNGAVKVDCLSDTGASAISFVNASFARKNKLPQIALSKPCKLRLADDKRAPNITHMALVKLALGDHVEELWCLITALGRFDIILGMPWLEQHDPHISFKERTITLNSNHCMSHCLLHSRPVTIHSNHSSSGDRNKKPKPPDKDIAEISAYAFMEMANRSDNQVMAMWPRDFEQLTLTQPSDDNVEEFTTDISALTAEDYEKFFTKMRKKPLSLEQLRKMIPKAYYKWIEVWNPREANKLPPYRPIDYEVHLREGSMSPAKRAYGKGYIRPSTFPYTVSILIVKKSDGGLRLCVDYRALNAFIIPNRNAPPLIKETLFRLCATRIYSKFDIISAFNEIRVKEGHEEKTAFLTRYGLYEYIIMPFGLCNAPATFQVFINDTLREYLDVFCTAYLDDILVYSDTKEEHIQHVGKVLEKLQRAGLYLNINKYDFHTIRVKYLGLIITTDEVEMDSKKIDAITQWKELRCVKDV